MPQHSAKDRLFAALLVERYDALMMEWANRNIEYYLDSPAYAYLKFLRGERRQHACYPIAIRALKQIEAAHGR